MGRALWRETNADVVGIRKKCKIRQQKILIEKNVVEDIFEGF
jgi:hypothetical protein